jgi:hypothetical protein
LAALVIFRVTRDLEFRLKWNGTSKRKKARRRHSRIGPEANCVCVWKMTLFLER